MRAAESILETIGATPVVRLLRVLPGLRLKLELVSPNGSAGDRVAWALVERAGVPARATIVEATTGNVGIGLAMLCRMRGYKLVAVMPEHVTLERRQLLKAWGAKVELTPAEGGIGAAIARARELAAGIAGAFVPDHFHNPLAVELHEATTAAELVETVKADGGIDAFAMGIGSGATITACGRALKRAFPGVEIVAVEPAKGSQALHRIHGFGLHAPLLDRAVVDRTVRVADEDAWRMRARLGREEGLLVGISTGANVAAAAQLGEGLRIYTLAVDTGERYFSMDEQFTPPPVGRI